MGGMAAQIPIKNDPAANERAIAKVVADKQREVSLGHDGTWVAHPGLVPVARGVFDATMVGPNQLAVTRDDVHVTAKDLLTVPKGAITEAGLRTNVNVGLQYLEAWLGGNGCVPLHNLMEDAATAEISRTQIWQWQKYGVELSDGRKVTPALVNQVIDEELATIKKQLGDERYAASRMIEAAGLVARMSTANKVADFLTLPSYDYLD
jgi:malate synthase